jgi:hypothetical protein
MRALLLALAAQLAILSLGGAWVWALAGRPRNANAPLWATAYPLGAVTMTCGLMLAGLAGVPFHRPWLATGVVVALAILVVVGVLRRRRAPAAAPPQSSPAGESGSPGLRRPARGGLAILLLAKVAFVVAELLHRPVSGWDSFAVWTLRAKVWAARGGLVLERGDPFFYGGAARPDYPPHASLLQTWTGVWIGEWHDVLINLPWGFYYLSLLAFCFYFVACRLSRDWALAATFALAGTPLLVVHAALAGYADLILATHFSIAVALLHESFARPGDRPHRLVALAFSLSLPLIKLEGIPLAAVCLAILGLRSPGAASRRRRWALVAALAVATAGLALANDTLRQFLVSSRPRPQAVGVLLDGLFRGGNWHFLWTLFVVVAAMRARHLWRSPLGWLWLNVMAAVIALSFALLFTSASDFALARSADSRLFLAVAPAALLFVVLALGDACREARRPDATRTADGRRPVAAAAICASRRLPTSGRWASAGVADLGAGAAQAAAGGGEAVEAAPAGGAAPQRRRNGQQPGDAGRGVDARMAGAQRQAERARGGAPIAAL